MGGGNNASFLFRLCERWHTANPAGAQRPSIPSPPKDQQLSGTEPTREKRETKKTTTPSHGGGTCQKLEYSTADGYPCTTKYSPQPPNLSIRACTRQRQLTIFSATPNRTYSLVRAEKHTLSLLSLAPTFRRTRLLRTTSSADACSAEAIWAMSLESFFILLKFASTWSCTQPGQRTNSTAQHNTGAAGEGDPVRGYPSVHNSRARVKHIPQRRPPPPLPRHAVHLFHYNIAKNTIQLLIDRSAPQHTNATEHAVCRVPIGLKGRGKTPLRENPTSENKKQTHQTHKKVQRARCHINIHFFSNFCQANKGEATTYTHAPAS